MSLFSHERTTRHLQMKVCFLFLNVVLQVVPAMKDGLVADWDVVESLWDHALRYSLNVRIDCISFSVFFLSRIWPLHILLGLLCGFIVYSTKNLNREYDVWIISM